MYCKYVMQAAFSVSNLCLQKLLKELSETTTKSPGNWICYVCVSVTNMSNRYNSGEEDLLCFRWSEMV